MSETKPGPIDVECPRCGAMVFTPCCVRRPGSIRPAYYYGWTDFHAARVAAAQRAREEGKK